MKTGAKLAPRAIRRELSVPFAIAGAAATMLVAPAAFATTYEVGPGKAYAKLQDVASKLTAGDVVEVQGGTSYPGGLVLSASGSAASKITIRGIAVGGARPILSGGANSVEFRGDHYVLENFDITKGSSRCVFHHGDDITLRNTVIHDCPGQGLLGADSDAGSLTMSYVEVYACGNGDKQHQIYMATDESAHPGSVFRMEHCFVHDGNGGNNIKSRAERNELYYNWIEGAFYRELELIGPDGQDEGLAREDSDVVGNVLRRTKGSYVARLGGDGTGATGGRYRFVNNTILASDGSSAVFQLFDSIASVELSNNVFYTESPIYTDADASWTTGQALLAGSNNWVMTGARSVPSAWIGTITGSDPGFADIGKFDLHPTAASPLVDHGSADTAGAAAFALTSSLAAPIELPQRTLDGTSDPRPNVGPIDIGAYEYGTGVGNAPPPGTAPDAGAVSPPASDGSGAGGTGPSPKPSASSDGSSAGSGGAPTAGNGGAPPSAPGTTPAPAPTPSATNAPAEAPGEVTESSTCAVGILGTRSDPTAWLWALLSLLGLARPRRRELTPQVAHATR